MKALLYRDTFPRLVVDLRSQPWKWMSRLVFLLGPWAAFWMVEILNQNDVFSDLQAWQVLMNLVWYYILFFVLAGAGAPPPGSRTGHLPEFCDWTGKPLCAALPGPHFVSCRCGQLEDGGQCGRRL